MNLRLLAPTLLLLAAPAAFASPITYTFNETIGTNTASGTITTDGRIGTLSSSDITGFTLTLSDGSETITSDASAEARVAGSALTATNSALSFNFSDTSYGGYFVLFANTQADSGGEGLNVLCLVNTQNTCNYNGSSNTDIRVNGFEQTSPTQSGTESFATVASTPEPSSLALFGTGALGMVAAVRRRFRRA